MQCSTIHNTGSDWPFLFVSYSACRELQHKYNDLATVMLMLHFNRIELLALRQQFLNQPQVSEPKYPCSNSIRLTNAQPKS